MTDYTKAPFPWFGGKAKAADCINTLLGDVSTYIEPFFGSGACLLQRKPAAVEIANDADGMVCNFWRSVQANPQEVAYWADYPVSEMDLYARHQWLIRNKAGLLEALLDDPAYHHTQVAGWWVWGIGQWIGSGWCTTVVKKKPQLTGNCGVHKPGHNVQAWMETLSKRLARVKVCCGDWKRVCTPAVLDGAGVLLDPPYREDMHSVQYAAGGQNTAEEVLQWCLSIPKSTNVRVVLCGYVGDGNEALQEAGWRPVKWKANGGWGNQTNGRGKENASKEVLWASPLCIHPRGFSSMRMDAQE